MLSPSLIAQLIPQGLLEAGAQCAPYNCIFQTGSNSRNWLRVEIDSGYHHQLVEGSPNICLELIDGKTGSSDGVGQKEGINGSAGIS